jgi:hypothetical protein
MKPSSGSLHGTVVGTLLASSIAPEDCAPNTLPVSHSTDSWAEAGGTKKNRRSARRKRLRTDRIQASEWEASSQSHGRVWMQEDGGSRPNSVSGWIGLAAGVR